MGKRENGFFQVSSDYILYGEQTNPHGDAFMLLETESDTDKMRILMRLLSYFVNVKETESMSDTEVTLYDSERNRISVDR